MFVVPLPAIRRAVPFAFTAPSTRLFDDTSTSFFRRQSRASATRAPAMDMAETDAAYTVVARCARRRPAIS